MEVIDCRSEGWISPTSYYSQLGAGASSVCPLWLKYVRFHQLRLPPGRVPRGLDVAPDKDPLEMGRCPLIGNPSIGPEPSSTQSVQPSLILALS